MIRYAMHKLFGWEYACFLFGFTNEVRRIQTAKDGTRYAFCYGCLIEEGTREWKQLL